MLQKSVSDTNIATGIVGEFSFESPSRAKAYTINSDVAANNVVGRYFTVVSEGIAQAGGTGDIAGILANPKAYARLDGLIFDDSPQLALGNGRIGECVSMGEIFVDLPGPANIGDLVLYDTETGELSTVAPSSSFTGVVATNTLTVSGFQAGGAPLRVGTEIKGTGVTPGTVITALGTGTGGNGTYTVTGAATVSSTDMTGNAVAADGMAFVPNARVTTFDVTEAGLASITLTN